MPNFHHMPHATGDSPNIPALGFLRIWERTSSPWAKAYGFGLPCYTAVSASPQIFQIRQQIAQVFLIHLPARHVGVQRFAVGMLAFYSS